MPRHPHFLPIVAATAGVALLSVMDAFMKSASLAAGAYSATLLRSLIGVAIIAPLWLLGGGRWPKPEVLRLHILRGTVSAFMALSFFYSLTKLPIAEAIAISFVAPLIALYLAAVLLGEKIRREAVIGSAIGFAGTLVIIGARLGRTDFDTESLKGLAAILFSALLYAWNFIIIRRQAQVSDPVEATVFHSLVPCVVLGVAAPWFFVLPESAAVWNVAAGSLLTIGGAMALTWAYARAEAQYLVPLEYTAFLWASVLGWLYFAEAVTGLTIAGVVLIVAGCWIATRQSAAALPPTEQSAL